MTQPIDFHGLHQAISELAELVKGWDIGDIAQGMTCHEAETLARVLARARQTEAAALVIYYHAFSDDDQGSAEDLADGDLHNDVYLAAAAEYGTLPIDGEALRMAYQHVVRLVDEETGS